MAKKTDKDREKADRRRRRFWDFILPHVEGYVRKKFAFACDDFEPADIEGPVLLMINHTCAYDPLFAGAAFINKPLTYIASEHLMRMKVAGAFLDRYTSIIPHSKGSKASRTALVAIKRIRRGESIFLAPEGEQTWDGRPMPVMPFTAKLVKGSGATLVTYLIEGGYLSAPRWALYTRKGKVCGHPVNVYSPETLRGMTDEEVEEAIARDLAFDVWEWQKSQPGGPVRFTCSKGGSADGLERAVFTCPSCGSFGTLRSDGDHIGCKCGFRIRLEDTGFFEESAPFETICDWERLDRSALRDRLAEPAAGGETSAVFSDEGITLVSIGEEHEEKELARGRLELKLSSEGASLEIGGRVFPLRGVSSMTMVLAGRVVFSDESGYYELRADKKSRVNLRKYVIAREVITEKVKE